MATVALVELDDPIANVLKDAFRQFNIQTTRLSGDVAQRLAKQKFEALALRLVPTAEPILEAARSSPSNRRIVIYGIGKTAQDTLRFSRFGINAILHEPLDRQSALKVVHATRLLVLNELRIYVRIPILAEVVLECEGRRFTGTTLEVSAGGMSIKIAAPLPVGKSLDVSFALPGTDRLKLGATVCWRRDPDQLGLRFEPGDERRKLMRRWIDDYLGIG
ncbi:MAG: PilZ domain-containing protein [Terriglobales bacterium]